MWSEVDGRMGHDRVDPHTGQDEHCAGHAAGPPGGEAVRSVSQCAYSQDHQGVSWIPMDAVATAATDFVLSSERLPALVNVVHPRLTPWRTIMEDINTSLGLQLRLVPFDQWLSALNVVAARATAEDTERLVSGLM